MDISALKKEAKSKKTPAQRLLELVHIPDASLQLAVAGNPNAPRDALEYLGGHGKFTILKAVAGHPNTPDAVLEKLARHKQLSVREALIEHPSLPPKALEALAADLEIRGYWLVMRQRASFSAAPKAIEALLASPDEARRRGLAGVVALTPELIKRLLADPEAAVRASLIENPSLLHAERQYLLHHPDSATRSAVARLGRWTEAELELFLCDPAPEVRAAIAQQQNATEAQLERLAGDAQVDVRAAVARRFWNLPMRLLEQLAGDPAEYVRAVVAQSHLAGEVAPVLENLSTDHSDMVRFCVACNLRTPEVILERLTADPSPTRFLLPGDRVAKLAERQLSIAERATWHLQQKRQPKPMESYPQIDLSRVFEASQAKA